MKILISSYSFCVGRGSEPGVGWNVARALAERGHEVTVLTTPEFAELNGPWVASCGLPLRLKEYALENIPTYCSSAAYNKWQKMIAPVVRELCREEHYDVVHHVTFNQYRGLKDVFEADCPYVLGPLGGAETVAPAFLAYGGMRLKSWLKELARYCPLDAYPLIARCRRAKKGAVLVSSCSTAARLDRGLFSLSSPVEVLPAIALNEEEILPDAPERQPGTVPYFLFYGTPANTEKGIWVMLRAMAAYRRRGGHARVVMVGLKEEQMPLVQTRAAAMGLDAAALELRGFVKRTEMLELMRYSCGVIYACFRDSGGMSALETLAQGGTVICYDIPSQRWLPDDMALKVPVPTLWQGRSRMADALADVLEKAETMPPHDAAWHARRCEWLRREMTWGARARRFEEIYRGLLAEEKTPE